ncbi:MAG: hypothetical protein ABFR63_11210, partial [Thermodesulfobacteriota bacterium]
AEEKGTLHVYRARQYMKIKAWDRAEQDYGKALELNHKGWIHLERGHFFMARENYEQAYEEARAAKAEVPTLAPEADEIMETAGREIEKKYVAENPPTIIMDRRVDPKRKTRFDVMRAQGGPVRATYTASSKPKASSKKKQTPTPRSYRKPKG